MPGATGGGAASGLVVLLLGYEPRGVVLCYRPQQLFLRKGLGQVVFRTDLSGT